MDQEKIWKYFQNEGIQSFDNNRGRLLFLARELARLLPQGAKILNIGIGNGAFEKIALDMGFEIFSLDPDQVSVESLREKLYIGERAKVGYSQATPFEDNFFDAVVASEVLEHLSDDALQKSIFEVQRILKASGIFLGTVPARENLQSQLVICPKCGESFHRWGHVQSFDVDQIFTLMDGNFTIKSITEKYFWSTLNWKGKSLSFAKLLIQKATGHFATEQSIFFHVEAI